MRVSYVSESRKRNGRLLFGAPDSSRDFGVLMRCCPTRSCMVALSEYICVKLTFLNASSVGHNRVQPVPEMPSQCESTGGAVPFNIHSIPALIIRFVIVVPFAALASLPTVK